jgi:bla regulator protein BlaR1
MSNTYIMMHSLGWAILHSLWQGALVFVALRLILFLFPNIQSKHKYAFAYGGLLLVFGSFAVNFYQELSQLQTAVVKITEGTGSFTSSRTLLTSTLSQHPDGLNNFIINIERFLPILVVLYGLGILMLSLRLTINLVNVKRLRNQGINLPSQAITEMLNGLVAAQDITQKVAIYISSKINVPATIGFLKPIILLPVASVNNLSTEELEAILIHELAHIKRNDYLLNIIQTVVETILFFNPFAWLISAQIRKEREYCCDDEVLTYTHYPIPYAKALANLETYRTQSLAMGANGTGDHLLNRIKRIIEMKKQPVNYGYLGLSLLLIAGITISAICFTPSFAQSKKKEEKEKTETKEKTEKTITKHKVMIVDSNGKRTVYNDGADVPEDAQLEMEMNLNKGLAQAMSSIQAMNIDVDSDEISANIEKAMKDIDWDKIGSGVNTAINSIDWNNISKEVNTAMTTVDWNAINAEVDAAMQKSLDETKDPVEKEKIRAEMKKAKAEVAKAMAEVKRELSEEKRKEIHIQMKQAKEDVDAARADMAAASANKIRIGSDYVNTDKLINEMIADGLINSEEGYTIRKDDNELYINGELQDDVIYKKYKPYLHASKVTIKVKGDKQSIQIHK